MKTIDSITTAEELGKQFNDVAGDPFTDLKAIGLMCLVRLEAIHEGIYELVNKPADKAVIIEVVEGFAVKSTMIQSVFKRDHDDPLRVVGQYEICVLHSDNVVKQIYFDSEEDRDKRYDDLLREWKGETTSG